MNEAIQSRALKTRAKLVAAAEEVIAEVGYGAMRVEEVVKRAQVAKGTFFAHFKDKDALMDRLIGARINAFLDDLDAAQPATSITELVEALDPLMHFMICERYVFDVILRHSGAAAKEEIGPIASTFHRFIGTLSPWLAKGEFRKDVDPAMLAEGVQAFMVNSMALRFCALHRDQPLKAHLTPYLQAWLLPSNHT